MATLLEFPAVADAPELAPENSGENRWLVFRYEPVCLFSLKMSRATSTAGKTLLIPTFYAVKMAVLDVALRHRLTEDPDGLVRNLARAHVRIGVPRHICVTGTLQRVRQERPDVERKRKPELPPYGANIAFREFVHFQGALSLAFDLRTCSSALVALLMQAAPAINYLGKRGSFMQYVGAMYQRDLDSTFTAPALQKIDSNYGHRATLDDFGFKATFNALSSFSSAEIRRDVERLRR